MPRVPVVDQTIQNAPLQDLRSNARYSSADFGAGMEQRIGQATGEIGQAIKQQAQEDAQLRLQAEERAKRARLMALQNEFDREMTPVLVELQSAKGPGSLESSKKYREKSQEVYSRIANGITDPYLKEGFTSYYDENWTRVYRSLSIDANAKMEKYTNDEFVAGIKTATDLASTAANDDKNWPLYKEDALQRVIGFANNNGLSNESRAQMIQQTVSQLSKNRIVSLIKTGNDLKAESLFKEYKEQNQFTAQDRVELDGIIEDNSRAVKADNVATEAFKMHQDLSNKNDPKSMEKSLSFIQSKFVSDPKTKKMAINDFLNLKDLQEKARDDALNNGVRTGMEMAQQAGYMTKELRDHFYEVGGGPNGGAQLVEKMSEVIKHINNNRQTEPTAFLRLQQWVDSGELAKLPPDAFYHQWYNQFSQSEWNEAQKYYNFARYPAKMTDAERKAKEGEMAGFVSEKEAVENVAKMWGYSYKDIEKLDANAKETSGAYQVIDALNKAISNRKRELSKQKGFPVTELSPVEINNAMSPVLMQLVTRYNNKGTIPAMKDVPEEEIQKIKRAQRLKNPDDPELSDSQAIDIYRNAVILGRIK